MRVLLDTNIVLDYLGANQGFTEVADKVFDLAAKRKDIKFVSSSAITDILYVLRRAVKDRNLVREKYESFRKKISILSVTEKDLTTMRNSVALFTAQHSTAQHSTAQHRLTALFFCTKTQNRDG